MNLLKPIKIANLELKNRMVMAPMGPDFDNFDIHAQNYYTRRAKGGASMILMNVLAQEKFDGPGPSAMITEKSIDGFKKTVEKCHKYDSKVCVQIMSGAGLGLKADDMEKPVSASAIPICFDRSNNYEELSKKDIKFIQERVASTARLSKEAGADAIEIHAYGGYLMDQFMTEKWNIRTDEYGGSFENRMRFLTEKIEVIQNEVGKDFPLIVKYTAEHLLPPSEGYRGIEEGIRIAKMLEDIGVHALHIDVGSYDNWHLSMPPIYQQEAAPQLRAAQIIKNHVDIPVITNGRLDNVGRAESAIQNGHMDIAAIGRGLLADPDLPNKVKENRADEIRSCIACNEGCIKSVSNGQTIDCAVNPETGHETDRKITKTNNPKKILVLGGGPGGCEAAIRAKEAGHNVELWEKDDHLGGNFFNASMPEFKRDGGKVIDYYKTMLDKLDIPIKFNKEANIENVRNYGADKVINAIGGSPIRPGAIPGIDKPMVTTANDVLQKRVSTGEEIVVIGGGLVGCETAIVLAEEGKKVRVIEMAEKILPEPVWTQNLIMLTELLEHPNITTSDNTKLSSIQDDSIIVEKNGKEETIICDNVVLAMGFLPNNNIYEELKNEIDIVNIGDSVSARKVFDAVHEAYQAVQNI